MRREEQKRVEDPKGREKGSRTEGERGAEQEGGGGGRMRKGATGRGEGARGRAGGKREAQGRWRGSRKREERYTNVLAEFISKLTMSQGNKIPTTYICSQVRCITMQQ